jgi:hypothetical protein
MFSPDDEVLVQRDAGFPYRAADKSLLCMAG